MTSEGTNMYMPVAPAYGYGNNGGGFGFGGMDGWWVILLLLIFGNGMFGGFGGGMWPMMMGGMGGGFELYPWLNNSQHLSDGFRDQQIQSTLSGIQNGITTGFGNVQLGQAGINQNICQTGNAITGAINNGFSAAEIAANGRQMANMQNQFGIQSAIQGGFAQTAAGTADLKYTVATEACADRSAIASGIRDVMENCNRNNQAILDKLCAMELDGVKGQLAAAQRENVGLQNQLNMAALRESQTAQNAFIQQGFANEVDALYNRLNSCPVPTTPVYGRTPIFTCPQQGGCGCGNGAF